MTQAIKHIWKKKQLDLGKTKKALIWLGTDNIIWGNKNLEVEMEMGLLPEIHVYEKSLHLANFTVAV